MAGWSIALSLSDVCSREKRKELVCLGEVRIDFLVILGFGKSVLTTLCITFQ